MTVPTASSSELATLAAASSSLRLCEEPVDSSISESESSVVEDFWDRSSGLVEPDASSLELSVASPELFPADSFLLLLLT